jgi:hypothetical protein
MRFRLSPALVAVLLTPLAACEEDDITAPPVLASIDLSIGDCAGLLVGESCQLGVVVRTQDGSVIEDAGLTWRTPNITIATVDFQGRVTGVREGAATIFAQSAPGPNDCQIEGVICDSLTVSVTEPDPGPGPQP